MKVFASFLVVLAMASPLSAAMILSEDFDGNGGTPPAVGTELSTLGWSGTAGMAISSTVIDAGNSGGWVAASGWPAATKGFTYTPDVGSAYVLTATLNAPTATAGSYSDLRISDGLNSTLNIGANMYGNGSGTYTGLSFGVTNGSPATAVNLWSLAQPVDVKIILKDQRADYSYRLHGDSAWTDAGGADLDTSFLLSAYNTIEVHGHGGVAGGIDSINLATPEPSSIVLLTAGLFGLLAYAWRKRK